MLSCVGIVTTLGRSGLVIRILILHKMNCSVNGSVLGLAADTRSPVKGHGNTNIVLLNIGRSLLNVVTEQRMAAKDNNYHPFALTSNHTTFRYHTMSETKYFDKKAREFRNCCGAPMRLILVIPGREIATSIQSECMPTTTGSKPGSLAYPENRILQCEHGLSLSDYTCYMHST